MKASNANSAAALVSTIQISCNARLAFGCWLFGNLASTIRGLVHPAALLARFRPDLAGRLPEPECAVGDDEPRRHVEPAPLQIEQQIAPDVRALAGAIGEADQFLAAIRRRADQHENALLFVFEARFEMDPISPDVDVALRRQIALPPSGVLVEPAILQGGQSPMPTTRQHPCRAAPPVPRRSRRSRYPSDKGSAAASRSTSTGTCRAAGSTARTRCGQDCRRRPLGRQAPPR